MFAAPPQKNHQVSMMPSTKVRAALRAAAVLGVVGLATACDPAEREHQVLRDALAESGVQPLDLGPPQDPALVQLGEALFFDRELSGNRDVSCATCHHPEHGTGDALSLSIGVGGHGLGPARELGAGAEFIPRNAPDLFNRGAAAWTTMFWDNRVISEPYEQTDSPAGDLLPSMPDSALAVQAMFPPTSRDEMRGFDGDLDVFGEENEIAVIPDDRPDLVWEALADRLLQIEEYVSMLRAAYPAQESGEFGFEHAAQALAAYEAEAFRFADSPWDRYLAGDDDALRAAEFRGAELFFGDANCAKCHNGPLLTDQQTHSVCTPQIGPGRGDAAPGDLGRQAITEDPADAYAFRTPALRNVALTGPWMHDGAYTDLTAAVRHHLDPQAGLMSYDPGQLDPRLQDQVLTDPEFYEAARAALDEVFLDQPVLSEGELDDIVAFLKALTDPAARDLSSLVPREVPSGLPVDGR